LANIPPNIRNIDLYDAYLKLIKKIITDYDQFFTELWKLKESNENFSYNPLYKSFKDNSSYSNIRLDPTLRLILSQNDLLSYNLIEFVLNGMFEQLESVREYHRCIEVMDSDPVIKDHLVTKKK
jgi:hypothetical protein